MDCSINPADFQIAAESIVDLCIAGCLGGVVIGYLLADPLSPLRVLATFVRFFRMARR